VEEFSFPEKETNGFSREAASCKIIRVTFWRMAFLKKYAVLFGITRLFLKGKDKAARRAQFPRRARTKLRSSYKVHATLRQTPRVTGFPIMTPGFFNVIPSVHTMILSRDSGNHGARPSTDGCRFQPPVPRCLSKKITACPMAVAFQLKF